jgi:hypothetical protein
MGPSVFCARSRHKPNNRCSNDLVVSIHSGGLYCVQTLTHLILGTRHCMCDNTATDVCMHARMHACVGAANPGLGYGEWPHGQGEHKVQAHVCGESCIPRGLDRPSEDG